MVTNVFCVCLAAGDAICRVFGKLRSYFRCFGVVFLREDTEFFLDDKASAYTGIVEALSGLPDETVIDGEQRQY